MSTLLTTYARDLAPSPRLTALGLPLVLIGGWLTLLPGGVLLAPLGIAAGLIGGGLLTARLNGAVRGGMAMTVLLLVGTQGNADRPMAIGFAFAFLLCVLVAALPVDSLRSGLAATRWLALGVSAWLWGAAMLGATRAAGPFDMNPNMAAGFLVAVGVHWLTEVNRGEHRRVPTGDWRVLSRPSTGGTGLRHWAAGLFSAHLVGQPWGQALGIALMLTGVVFTGSRWALLALLVALVVLGVSQRANRTRIGLICAVLAAVALLWPGTAEAFRVTASEMTYTDTDAFGRTEEITGVLIEPVPTLRQAFADAGRVLPDRWPSLLPQGYVGGQDQGAHNLFVRVAVASGWGGLAVFVALLGVALWRASPPTRALLAVVLFLGMMDYYMWGPFALAPLLWAGIGLGWRRA